MAYIINTDNRQLIDAGENQLSYIERPNIIYGDGGVLSFDLLSGRQPLECSTSDTWELYADTDYIHTTGAGLLANGYSGAVTSIEATDLTNTPELTGFLLLQNSVGERDRIPYSEYNAGTGIFTVDDTLENIYLAGDSVLIEDQLVLYSGNANFNNSADREDVNVLTGKICVRYDALTRGFLNKITAPNTRVHIEIWRYIPGQLRPQKVLQDDIYCSPTVGTLEGAPSTNDPVYYTAAQTLALLNAGYEIELSDDGITWYELTFDELEQPIMPLTARWWHYRNALTNGNWSATVPLLVGPKGDDGDAGAGFSPDVIGLLSGLSTYDDEPAGFTYLSSDTGNVYFKLSATTADWSAPSPFRGQDGADGVNGSKWYSETGLPSALIGIDGDYYLDNATGKVYHKASGAWVFESLLKGAPGIDGTNGTDGLDGATWHFGSGVPAVELGVDGDAYLDTVNFNTYTKAAGTWTFKGTIKGDKGADGEGITPKGEYNPATDYILNDAVSYEGSFWRAKDATTSNAPPTLPNTSNTYWDIVVAKGENGNDADALQIKYAATADAVTWSVDYAAGDSFAIFSVDGGVTWTTAIRIKGADGVSSYAYIAYASDSSGTGFSLTPTDALKYRAEIKSSTELTPPTSSDFTGATWVKYLGDDGAKGADGDVSVAAANQIAMLNAIIFG